MKTTSEKLLNTMKADQEMRSGDFSQSDLEELSEKNTEELKKIINEIGWPTISKVGKEASFAAWLLAQHSDQDPDFQEDCLKLMTENKDDVEKKNIAYLTDRVLVGQNKEQLYGTQFYTDENDNFGPRPIKDIESIETRWKDMGLNKGQWKSFAEYKQFMLDKFGKK